MLPVIAPRSLPVAPRSRVPARGRGAAMITMLTISLSPLGAGSEAGEAPTPYSGRCAMSRVRLSSAAAQPVEIVLNGTDPAPREERRRHRRVRQPAGHGLDGVGGEASHLPGPLHPVTRPALVLAPGGEGAGQRMGALPGERLVSDPPGDAEGLVELGLRFGPPAGREGDLPPDRMAPGDLLGRA